MLYKAGVNTAGVQPPTWYAIGVIEAVYSEYGALLVVTSLTDGIHPDKKNIHGNGFAVDCRTRDVPAEVLPLIVKDLILLLNPKGYDVVVEGNHIHVEYDPKGAENWQSEIKT